MRVSAVLPVLAVLAVFAVLAPACSSSPLDDPCLPDPCSVHGTCDGSSGVAVCTCETGYQGAQCQDCAPGYHRDPGGACLPDEPDPCEGETCSGHGTCDGSSGVAVCTCETGYQGAQCQDCAPDWERDPVTGRCVTGPCIPDPCDPAEHRVCDPLDGSCPCAPGFCEIEGTCLPAGSLDPTHACAVCDPDREPRGWSLAPEGAACRPAWPLACDEPERCDGQGLDCPEDPGAYLGDPTWPLALRVTAEAVYCWPFDESLTLEESRRKKAMLHYLPGAYPLPDAGEGLALRLPFCLDFGPGLAAPAPAGAGSVRVQNQAGHRSFQLHQPLQAAERWTLESWLSAADGADMVLDGSWAGFADFSAQTMLCREDCTQWLDIRRFDSCTFEGVARHLHQLEFEGGRVQLELRLGWSMASTEPGIFFAASGQLDGVAFDQRDYWKLVYKPEHHHFSRSFAVLFDAPIGGACALRVDGLVPWQGEPLPRVATAGCDLAPIRERAASSLRIDVIQP